MIHKVFIDSDVLLDVLAKREPFYTDSAEVLSLAENHLIEAYTTPVVIAYLYFLLTKLATKNIALKGITRLRAMLKILNLNQNHVDKAISSKFTDFEDALQYYASLDGDIDYILTRNTLHYKSSEISVYTPTEFLNFLRMSE